MEVYVELAVRNPNEVHVGPAAHDTAGTAEAAPAAKAKRAGGAKKAPRRSGARAKKGATQTDG